MFRSQGARDVLPVLRPRDLCVHDKQFVSGPGTGGVRVWALSWGCDSGVDEGSRALTVSHTVSLHSSEMFSRREGGRSLFRF